MRPWQANEELVFFPLESFDKTQNSQRVQTFSVNQIWRGEKRPSSGAWLGLIEHACQISTTYLQKTAWISDAF